ncbi:hypothetical protein NL676_027139 [Syzygium grande]|nr:hypothetical protein NL676_027139 [Syzygium grande]
MIASDVEDLVLLVTLSVSLLPSSYRTPTSKPCSLTYSKSPGDQSSSPSSRTQEAWLSTLIHLPPLTSYGTIGHHHCRRRRGERHPHTNLTRATLVLYLRKPRSRANLALARALLLLPRCFIHSNTISASGGLDRCGSSGEIFSEDDGHDGDAGSELLEEEKEEVLEPAYRQPRMGGKVPDLSLKEKKELASWVFEGGEEETGSLRKGADPNPLPLKKGQPSRLAGRGCRDSTGIRPLWRRYFQNTQGLIFVVNSNDREDIRSHRTCPGELDEVVEQLELLTGSVVVGQIGRTIIIYRPSITKMQAEEKKRQARRVFVRKGADPHLLLLHRGQIDRLAASARFVDPIIRPLINTFPAKMKYEWKRHLEAWRYRCGLDYEL